MQRCARGLCLRFRLSCTGFLPSLQSSIRPPFLSSRTAPVSLPSPSDLLSRPCELPNRQTGATGSGPRRRTVADPAAVTVLSLTGGRADGGERKSVVPITAAAGKKRMKWRREGGREERRSGAEEGEGKRAKGGRLPTFPALHLQSLPDGFA